MLLDANTSDDEDANIGLNRNEFSKNGKNSDFGLQRVVTINMAKNLRRSRTRKKQKKKEIFQKS